MDLIEHTKGLLGDPKDRIKLYDFVLLKTNEFKAATSEEYFPVQGQWSPEEFIDRVKRYETASKDLRSTVALIGFWGESYNTKALILPTSHLAGRVGLESGNSAWLRLRWYPVLLLVYSTGIAAIAAGKYENLKAIFEFRLPMLSHSIEQEILLIAVISGLSDLSEMFKHMPGLERRYTPRSDYINGLLRPEFEQILGFNEYYDYYFDRFEVLLALEYVHLISGGRLGGIWGPPGRFAWMFHRGNESSPYHRFISQAESEGEAWPVIKAGFFGGSLERFREIAAEYAQWVGQLGWY